MADLGEEAYSSQMKVIATFLRLLEELMRNKQQDLRYGTKTQRRGIFRRMKDFVGGVFKKVYDGTFGRLSRNGKDYGQLDLNDPAVAKLFADTMKQMGMDTMHEDNNLLFSTSDIAKIMAFSKMVEQELGKKIEHENDTPEKEQSQEHGQDHEKQADARDWSDYPATPEQIELTATVLAADEGVSIDEIKKDFSENPSIGELQIALEAKGHDTMAIQPDLRNYATPEQRAQLDMLKDKGVIGEDELMQLGKYPSQDKASEVLGNHADAVKMLDSDEISNRAEAIRSHDGMDPDSRTKQVESWKEDLSAKVGNAFEASRDANGRPNLNNFARQCNLRGIAVQFANDGELLFTDANQHHKQVRADNLDPKGTANPRNTLDIYGEIISALPVSLQFSPRFYPTEVEFDIRVEPNVKTKIGETRLHENDLRQIIDGTEIILPVKLEKYFPGSGFTPDQKIVIALRLVKRGGLKLNL